MAVFDRIQLGVVARDHGDDVEIIRGCDGAVEPASETRPTQ